MAVGLTALLWTAATTAPGQAAPRFALTVLAQGQVDPWSIAAAGRSVYWAVRGPQGAPGRGAVLRIEHDGGLISPVAVHQTNPCGLTLDSSHVYWASHGSGAAGFKDGALFRAPRRGGPPERLLAGLRSPWALAVASGHHGAMLYFATLAGALGRLPTTGLADEGTARVLAAGQRLTDLALGGHEVFFTDGAAGELRRLLLTSGDSQVLASGQSMPIGLALGPRFVYWANAGDGTVARAPRDGGKVEVLARGLKAPRAVALGPAHIYVTDAGAGQVVRVSRAGGPVEVVAAGQKQPHALAVSPRGLFFTDLQAGTVVRVDLPH
jgi:sugar lactone lactonase YvrE